VFVRELLKMIPRTLLSPWERRDPLPPRARHRSYVHKIEPVRGGKLNFHNTLYGGTLMRWLETTAALSAHKHAEDQAMRLAGLHGLNFIRAVERDRFVHIRAMVVHTTSDSLTTLVSVHSEDPVTATSEETLRAFLTYVPVDAGVRISPVDCLSEEDRALFAEVEQRLALQRSLSVRLASAA
jgi:acyl-CoA hydrolase